MSVLAKNPWLKHLAVVLVTVFSLGSLTLASTPAQARVFVGVGIPFPGWGIMHPHRITPMVITGTRPMDIPGAFSSAAILASTIATITIGADEPSGTRSQSRPAPSRAACLSRATLGSRRYFRNSPTLSLVSRSTPV
jgi:hypothetical protein